MNKSKIDWCDMTWNPVTGCLHSCEYCYARKIAHRYGTPYSGTDCHELSGKINSYDDAVHTGPYPYEFAPTFHKYRLNEPKKKTKGRKIFVCSMADLFGEWVPNEWIEEIYMACQKADWHKYLFLTKNPKKYRVMMRSNLDYRCYMWFGTTIENQTAANKRIPELLNIVGNKFLSIEPLLGPVNLERIEPEGRNDVIIHSLSGTASVPFTILKDRPRIKWIIVGGLTGPGAKPTKPEWVQNIIEQARAADIPVFLKDNLNWPEKIQEYPW